MGRVFDIQHFSTGDGPGIRTTVFFKGCPLHCLWCHNPESQSLDTQVFFTPSKCIGCRSCEKVCPEGQVIRHSIECAEACHSGCLELVGYDISAQKVIQQVLKDKAFYDNSGGGITLSGGEPLYQPEFAWEILSEAKKEGLHTAIETSGCGKLADYLKLLPLTDLFLWDIKLMEPKLYEHYVGGSLQRIIDNLRAMHNAGANLRLRLMYIPEIHERPEVFAATKALLEEFNTTLYDVLPYHPMGNAKRDRLELEPIVFDTPTEQQLWEYCYKLKGSSI